MPNRKMPRNERHPRYRTRNRNRSGGSVGKERKRYKCCGVTFQILLYIVNGLIWIQALFCFGFGLVIGLSTNTIGTGSDFSYLDFFVTTPATIFFLYGILLLIIAFVGCFASVSAKGCTIVIYVILIILFIIFDVTLGIHLSYRPNAYKNYMEKLDKSMDGYGNPDASKVGIIPMSPTTYWDNLQRKGRCCGLNGYLDWKNTTLGREKHSVPDSCCVLEYDYEGCGFLAWKHPDHNSHIFTSVWSGRGCLSVFPQSIQKDDNRAIDWLGKALFALLLLCMVFAIVLLCLVCNRRFKPAMGLTNPGFIETPEDPCMRAQTRVHPANTSLGQGDAGKDMLTIKQKRVRFNEDAPRIICKCESYEDA